MIEDGRGRIDHDVCGAGQTIVLVPGSCSTGAAWRPVMAAWNNRFRCVTTSLLGYGGTAERRTQRDPSIWHEVDVVETVIRKAGGPVHLVGHSFGGLVAVAVALRKRVPLASLAVIEAPAAQLLRHNGEQQHYRAIRQMTNDYFAAFARGDVEAISTMIDFYGGAGTFRVLAIKCSRLRSGNDGSQYSRLGERVWLPVIRGFAVFHRHPGPRHVGRGKPPGGAACQRSPSRMHDPRGFHRDKCRCTLHDCNSRKSRESIDRPARTLRTSELSIFLRFVLNGFFCPLRPLGRSDLVAIRCKADIAWTL